VIAAPGAAIGFQNHMRLDGLQKGGELEKLVLNTAALVASVLCLGAAAEAQSGVAMSEADAGTMYQRNRNLSVMDRASLQNASAYQHGAFLFSPELRGSIEFNDNIFATSSNEETDVILEVNPTLGIQSTWSRHALTADLSATQREYMDFGDESVFNYSAGVGGRLDVVRGTWFDGGLRYSDNTEPRTSAGAAGQAAKPIEYDQFDSFVGFNREFGRYRAEAKAEFSNFDYDDSVLFGGAVADQDFRDRDDTTLTVRGDYAVSPDTSWFVRASYEEESYDLSPPDPDAPIDRDSSGYTAQVGADFDIRHIARGEVGVGYTTRDYDDPSQETEEGASVSAAVDWFPTQLTTVGVSASRSIEASAVAGSAGRTNSALELVVDHELRRDVVLTAAVNWGQDDYNSIDRTDERFGGSVSVSYFWTENVGVRAGYAYTEQDSSGAAGNQDYTRNVVSVSFVIRP